MDIYCKIPGLRKLLLVKSLYKKTPSRRRGLTQTTTNQLTRGKYVGFYVVTDKVMKITSEEDRNGKLSPLHYLKIYSQFVESMLTNYFNRLLAF